MKNSYDPKLMLLRHLPNLNNLDIGSYGYDPSKRAYVKYFKITVISM